MTQRTKTREERIANGTIVPNSFQHPNIYEDWLAYYLTPEEHKVLGKAIREILGWEDKIADRRARIALSVFVDGKTKYDGETLCLGCGLGLHAVRKALDGLDRYRILQKEGDATQDGQLFYLQQDTNRIDWDGLAARREEWDEANAAKTRKATQASLESRGITSDVGGNVTRYPKPQGVTSDVTQGVASHVRGVVTSDVREGVTSDVNKETQIETQKESQEKDSSFSGWGDALKMLESMMPAAAFNQWFRGSTASRQNGVLTIQTRYQYADQGSADRLRPQVLRAMHLPEDDPLVVRFEVAT